MTQYVAKIKHGPDEDSITTLQFDAANDDRAHWYLHLLAIRLDERNYTLVAREERAVE